MKSEESKPTEKGYPLHPTTQTMLEVAIQAIRG